jgi:hypothetical protein
MSTVADLVADVRRRVYGSMTENVNLFKLQRQRVKQVCNLNLVLMVFRRACCFLLV